MSFQQDVYSDVRVFHIFEVVDSLIVKFLKYVLYSFKHLFHSIVVPTTVPKKMPGVSRLRHVHRSHPIQDVPRA